MVILSINKSAVNPSLKIKLLNNVFIYKKGEEAQ